MLSSAVQSQGLRALRSGLAEVFGAAPGGEVLLETLPGRGRAHRAEERNQNARESTPRALDR